MSRTWSYICLCPGDQVLITLRHHFFINEIQASVKLEILLCRYLLLVLTTKVANDPLASSYSLPNSSTGLQLCGNFSLCTKIEKRRFERISAADVVDVEEGVSNGVGIHPLYR